MASSRELLEELWERVDPIDMEDGEESDTIGESSRLVRLPEGAALPLKDEKTLEFPSSGSRRRLGECCDTDGTGREACRD